MKIPNCGSRREIGIDMTPMIDVVFQLIIFFLLTGHLTKQEAQLQLPLPKATSGTKPDESETARLTINVQADGRVSLAGHAVEPGDLEPRLRDRVAQAGPQLEVRIRGDRSVEYRHVSPIMRACARAGIWNVSFAVYRPEDNP